MATRDGRTGSREEVPKGRRPGKEMTNDHDDDEDDQEVEKEKKEWKYIRQKEETEEGGRNQGRHGR